MVQEEVQESVGAGERVLTGNVTCVEVLPALSRLRRARRRWVPGRRSLIRSSGRVQSTGCSSASTRLPVASLIWRYPDTSIPRSSECGRRADKSETRACGPCCWSWSSG